MQLYDWDENYSTYFEPIDNQHKLLLGFINKLILNQNKDKKVILMLLKELILYAEFHFFSEENFMVIYRFPQYEEHRHEHLSLLDEVEGYAKRFKNDKISLEDIVKMVVNWFVLHTTKTDKDLGMFLAGKVTESDKL